MNLETTLEKIERMDERLDSLRETRDEYHTIRNGYIYHNKPGKVPEKGFYLGDEVTEDEFLDTGYKVVDELIEADRIFRDLQEVKNGFSELDEDTKIGGREVKEWIHEINKYMEERREIVEEIFDLSEPINDLNEIDFDIRQEYCERAGNIDHLMSEEA